MWWYLTRQLPAKWRAWRNLDDMMRRRAAVEQYLADCASGKKRCPLPDECRTLALKLGTPSEVRRIKLPSGE